MVASITHYSTYPNIKLFRVIRTLNNEIPNHVLLSSYPLPSFTIFSNKKRFYCYSINGKLLGEDIDSSILLSPKVFTDTSFNDFLVNIKRF